MRKCCSASVSVGAISAPRRPALDRAQQRVERDDGLARADVALEEPLHRTRLRQVGVDLRDRLLLVLRQLERQQLAVARRSARPARRARSRPPPRAPSGLARGPPGARAARRRRGAASPPRPPRPSAAGAAPRARPRAAATARGPSAAPGAGRAGRARTAAPARRASRSRLRRHLLARRVDGREVGGRGDRRSGRRSGRRTRSASAARAAAPRARLQLLGQPGLVEPDRGDLAAAVGDASLTIASRRDGRATETRTTSPAIAASSPASRSAIGRSGTACS